MLDLTKPMQTRDGRAVVIYCTDVVPGDYPIHGRIVGEPVPRSWKRDGHYTRCEAQEGDLINVPEPEREVTTWLNVYEAEGAPFACAYDSRREADRRASSRRIACVRSVIKYRPGQFDEEDGNG